jgi:S1-C subfamily serine protease
VIAVGNPFDYEYTVTVGVVSAKGYRPVEPGKQRKVIQTDAAINVGNSGGPLVDLGGNVVGINYAIYSPTGTTAGIGFAIPINEARTLARLLIEGGPWVGLPANGLMVNSPGLKAHFNLPTDRGVVIFYIEPGSPADRAGLQMGDIILSVDGQVVKDGEQVQDIILTHSIGDVIRFEIQRGDRILRVDVVAGRMSKNR